MRKKINHTLLGQMLLMVSVIILLMSAIFLLACQYIMKMVRSNTLTLNENTLIQIESRTSEFFNSMERIGTTLAYSPTASDYFRMDARERILAAEDMNAVFSNIMLLEEDIIGIHLYDSELTRIASTGAEAGNRSPKLVLHQKMAFSSLFTIGSEDRNYYCIYFPVYDLEDPRYGTQVGMCVFLMKTDFFCQILAETKITEHSQIYLTDGEYRIIASNVKPDVKYLIQKLRKSSREYYVQTHEIPIDGWNIVNRIPQRELYQEKSGRMMVLTAAYLIAAGMTGMLVCFFYRRMIYPIQKVDGFIKRLAEHPKERMCEGREDEIGTVIRSLNTMMDDIQRVNVKAQASQKKMYEEQMARKQLQILAYRNQINPHFLYNTFECIRAMALYYDVEDIAEITMALSNVFRFAVKADNIVTVEDEAAYIREYATIIDYRFMGKIDINVEADEAIAKKKVIRLMLQPLVENAVFHGLEQKMDDGEVDVSIRMQEGGYLLVVVEDDGIGMDEETLRRLKESMMHQKQKKGIGIANIYQRLRLFYGQDMEFQIESRIGQGTRIIIRIPDDVQEGEEQHV